jgi:GR25 family glycosyltransferase involved in LPS biosynthesis
MTSTDGMHVNYTTVIIFLLIIFTTLFAHTYFFIIRQYYDHTSDISNFEKTLERLPKSTLLHINGSIKHLGAAKQIYIINLPYRKDRRTGSIALFQTLDLDAFLVPAYNIHSPEVVSRTRLVHQGHITLVELACWASHMRVWLEIAASENNDSWVFVFEDDIDLEMATFDVLESLPRDLWNIPDMIYLGYCGDPPGLLMYEGTRGYRVHQAINPSCTHAYAIRSRTASKLIHLLSSPRRAVDDEIVRLVDTGKISAFSIHPPLALQQRITSSHPSDVNPIKNTLIFQIKTWINSICQWWRGVEFIDHLKDSALARADFNKADNWRRHHEHDIWRSGDVNVSSFSLMER